MKLQLPTKQGITTEEAEILSLIKNKESRERGYKKLIDKYSQKVYWQIRRMVYSHQDTDDLTQEVFIRIFENIETFNHSSKLSTWIYRIAYNHTINFIKSKQHKLSKLNSEFEEDVISKLPADTMFNGDNIELTLQKAILTLPAKQRAVFQMRYYDEISFAEIAEITKTSEGALKASYHIAAQKIEDYIKANDN